MVRRPILPKRLIDLLGNQERDDSESEDSETDENDGEDIDTNIDFDGCSSEEAEVL